jgi:membrane protease YdiL (CAAX protease family)
MSGPADGMQPFTRKAVYLGWLFEGGLIVVSFGLGWLLNEPPLATVKWNLASIGLGVAATGPMLVGLVLLIWLPIHPVRRLLRIVDEIGRPFFARYTLLDLAVLSLLAGFGEETLFRGVIQGAVEHRFGTWIGLVAASVLFGAVHALTPTYVVLAMLAGVYLGGVWLLTENLLVVILAHALYDFLALTYLLRVKAAAKETSDAVNLQG